MSAVDGATAAQAEDLELVSRMPTVTTPVQQQTTPAAAIEGAVSSDHIAETAPECNSN